MRAAVLLGSELLGDVAAAVVSIDEDATEIVLRTSDCSCVADGEVVTVHFLINPHDEMVARCRVAGRLIDRHRNLPVGLVLQVLGFDDNLPLSLPGSRVLH